MDVMRRRIEPLHELDDRVYLQCEELLKILPGHPMAGSVGREWLEKIIRNGVLAALWSDDRIVGLIGFYANDMESRCAYGTLLAILPEARDRESATDLLQYMIDHSWQQGMRVIRFEVRRCNPRVIEFYTFFYNAVIVDDTKKESVLMEYPLEPFVSREYKR